MIDFAALPPEINSARMYSGPGSAPMLAAGTAWNHLAAEIRSAADAYSSVISGLTGENWLGPSSASMAAAAAPYAAWMNTTAAQAEQTAIQAHAAATAYETALSMTVPPALITTNRTHVKALLADNVLGHNAAAIAATEASYGEMWAQDTAAMYGYTNSSSAAAQFTPFSQPAPTTTAAGLAAQSAAATQAAATSAGTGASSGSASTAAGLPSWLGDITAANSDTATTGLAGLLNDLDGANGSLLGGFLNNGTVANLSNAFTTSGLLNPTGFIDTATCFSYLFPSMASGAAAANASGLAAGLGSGVSGLGSASLHGLGAAVSAGVGQAAPLGALSVPQSWVASAPAFSQAAAALPGANALSPPLGATPLVPEPVLPGTPLSGGAFGFGDHEFDEPLYGLRPTVMSRSPAAG